MTGPRVKQPVADELSCINMFFKKIDMAMFLYTMDSRVFKRIHTSGDKSIGYYFLGVCGDTPLLLKVEVWRRLGIMYTVHAFGGLDVVIY